MSDFQISGNIVLIEEKEIKAGTLYIRDNRIDKIEFDTNIYGTYILPGFIDSHIHIESSMLVPKEFGRIAPIHGTVASISDPHEIANVLGVEGVQYMIDSGKESPFKFHFGAPSCVPATSFETAGDEINPEQIDKLMQSDDIYYLAEMMNYPGVLFDDEDVLKKIASAKKYNKPVDGHAPGLRGDDAKKYISAGISTDHECFTKEEALDKLKYGMKILIREGSAAKNFNALYTLIDEYPDMVMLCSDDKHPDDLIEGHINQLVIRALNNGQNLFNILKTACINPVKHYKMDVGLLKEGDKADFIEVDNLKNFTILKTYIDGELIAENGKTTISYSPSKVINKFNVNKINANALVLTPESDKLNVIEVLDGELITNKITTSAKIEGANTISDIENDVLKMVVVNRYSNQPISKAFIKNFNLKEGAIASCVAHDSHNIIAVGCDDESIAKAVNLVIEGKGGISLVSKSEELSLELPIAGIMTDKNAYEIGKLYSRLDKKSKELGSKLRAPYMSLSFMALLVIPSLKLSDKGLFNGDKFEFEKIFK